MLEAYPSGGARAVQAALPWRTRAAINRKAGKMGITAPRKLPRPPSIHQPDPHIDDEIRRFYASPIKRGTYRAFCRGIGKPPWYVKRRAAALGVIVPRLRELPWSEAEVEILSEFVGYGAESIRARLKRAGFKRSITAIEIKRKRLQLNPAEERELAGFYDATTVASGCGVHLTSVLRWIRLGQLRAKQNVEATGSPWRIAKRDLQRFLATYHQAVDLRKIDREWFMHMAFGDTL